MTVDDRIPSPTFAQLDRQAKFDAVTAEFSPFLQAAGLPVVTGDAFDTPADYRAGLVAALNDAVPSRVPLPRAELKVIKMLQNDVPTVFDKVVLATKAAVIQGARTGDKLMSIVEKRPGRARIYLVLWAENWSRWMDDPVSGQAATHDRAG